MKKSKVIVPALGILMLSTAASISGSVAWFTAVRNFNATISSFAVVKTVGDLKCSFTGFVGTTAGTLVGENYTTLSVDANTVLTDASFDHNDLKVAYPTDATGTKFAEHTALGFAAKATDEGYVARGTTKTGETIYSALSWTMTFKNETSSTASSGLFINFDTDNTAATATVDQETKKGFRIAFVAPAGGTTVIWAPFRASSETSELKYVSSVDGETHACVTTNYTVPAAPSTHGNVITSDKPQVVTMSTVDDGVTASEVNTKSNYIGTFTSSVSELTYKCVAWFEGTDSSIDSTKALATISVKLSFDARMLS